MTDTSAPVTPRTDAGAELTAYVYGTLAGYSARGRDKVLASVKEYVVAIEREAAAPAATEALRVLDNLLRHHNTIHHGECEFARQAVAALASPEEPA